MKNCNILVLILFLMGNGLSISMPPLADRINTEHAHTPMQALDVDAIELMSQQEIDILFAELESQKHNDALIGLVDTPSNYTKERRPAPAALDYLKELCDELPIQSPVEAKSTQEQVAVAAAALSFAQAQEGVSKSIDSQKEQVSAGSVVPSSEEIVARNKRDAERDKAQRESQSTLPALAAAAPSSKAANPSGQENRGVTTSGFRCEPCGKVYSAEYVLEYHKRRIHGEYSLQKRFQCTVEDCKARFDGWGWMKRHALEQKHGLPIQDNDQEKWRNLQADFWKKKLSAAASSAPSKEEITARNKRAQLQQMNLVGLPLIPAAASSSQATAPSLEKEKVLPVGAKRAAVIYPEDQPPAKKQKSLKKNLAKCYPKYIDVALYTFPCSVEACKDMFRSQSALNAHVKGSHTNKTKKFICPIPECGAGFHMNSRMNEHEKNHAKAKKTLMEQAQTK